MGPEDRDRLDAARALLVPCTVCPRDCRVDRSADEVGWCGIGNCATVASVGPHFGEEPPLVGRGGSGTIFLGGCSLLCRFCQNFEISHGRAGRPASPTRIAGMMLALQRRGCHNVNFVTPTHVMPQLLEATLLARADGLGVPVVWNCGGYESIESLRLLEGHVEIFMPDAKFMDPDASERLMQARDYPDVMKSALKEMHRQVGDLVIVDGIARRGLLVRHLVMPGHVEDSLAIVDFLSDQIGPDTAVNVMGQYHPAWHASQDPLISRRPTSEEVDTVRTRARERGLRLMR